MNGINGHSSTINGHAGVIKKGNTAEKVNGDEALQLKVAELSTAYRSILSSVGEDPYREGLLKTPERAAKALMFFTKGYNESLKGKELIELIKNRKVS